MIAIHPQPGPAGTDQLRWITPAGVLPGTGVATTVPAPLGALLRDGTLSGVRVEPAAVVTTLAAGRDWARDGGRVRSALHAALDDPAGWAISDTPPAGSATSDTPPTGSATSDTLPAGSATQDAAPGTAPADEVLRAAAEALIAGSAGDFARSHGGHIELVGARDGVVTVRLLGACRGCPAAVFTLRRRIEEQLRRRCPGVRQVVDAGARHHPLFPAGRPGSGSRPWYGSRHS